MPRRAPDVTGVKGAVETNDAIAGRLGEEVDRVKHLAAVLIDENVAVGRLRRLLRHTQDHHEDTLRIERELDVGDRRTRDNREGDQLREVHADRSRAGGKGGLKLGETQGLRGMREM